MSETLVLLMQQWLLTRGQGNAVVRSPFDCVLAVSKFVNVVTYPVLVPGGMWPSDMFAGTHCY